MGASVSRDSVRMPAVEAPLVLLVVPKARQEIELAVIDTPDSPGLDEFVHGTIMGHPAPGEKSHVSQPFSLRPFVHGFGIGGIQSQRLLAEHMQAGIDRRQ